MELKLQESPQWRWNWESLCGAEGLKIWNQERHDLGMCFQQLCLEIPALALLACASTYYFGRQIGYVTRGKVQLYSIYMRCLVVLFMALLPVIQIYTNLYKGNGHILTISYFLWAVQGIAWFSHLWFIVGLRHRLGLSPRGPLFICMIWSLLFIITVISLRSYYILYQHATKPNYSLYLAYGFSIIRMWIQIFYGISLIPGEGSSEYIENSSRYSENGETQALLSHLYYRFSEETDPNYLGVAMEDVNFLSKLLFYWVNPLMGKGVEGKLRYSEDLYDLPISFNSDIVSNKLEKTLIGNVDEQIKQQLREGFLTHSVDFKLRPLLRYNVSLLNALHKCFWKRFYSIGFLKLVADCAGFCGPLLLYRLISFIENRSENIQWGYLYASGLLATTLISSLCDSHFNFWMSLLGLKMRASLITTIYKKTLAVSQAVLHSEFSDGEIINFMSTDTDRIVNSCPSFHAFWSIPFQLFVTLYLLYKQVGLAFLAGLVFSIVLIPINKIIANKIGELSTKMMHAKDNRVKMITEVLRGIKAIKLYVWEHHFIQLLMKLRDKELKYLKGRKYLDALCVYFWATTPVLISILTFGTYVLMGNKLTAATVFTGMALLNMLISPLNAFPWVLNGLAEAWVSIKRIQRFLDLPDMDFMSYYTDLYDLNADIEIRNGQFNWGHQLSREDLERLHLSSLPSQRYKTSLKGKGKRKILTPVLEEQFTSIFSLNNINLKIVNSEFTIIVGTIGSGKSTLLLAILAELLKNDGQIGISQKESGFGYASQQPWLQRGTVRKNILFGRAYDDARYKTVLFACGLAEDIHLLPNGDLTGVGEGGVTLSGGQKARIALARAVYQDKSIYLLDDILSAVDTAVAKHIFKHCILGLLKDKTRILCTHSMMCLGKADKVIVMEGGEIKKQGSPDSFDSVEYSYYGQFDLNTNLTSNNNSNDITCSTSFLNSSIQNQTLDDEKDNDSILHKEIQQMGTLNFRDYRFYWKSIGYWLSFLIILSVIMMQISRNMTDWWLSHWVSSTMNNNHSNNRTIFLTIDQIYYYSEPIDYYMQIYIEFVIFNTIFTLFRAFLFAYGGIVAAMKIHKMLLICIIKAKMLFFDTLPIGRILNRLSSDTYTIDDSLPFILNILLAQFFGLLGTVIITIYGLPWVCLVLFPLIPVYHWLQHHYRQTSRELKRISSVTLSPIYSHFNESLQGLSTIRAMRAEQRFKKENEDNIDNNLKAQFASQAAARWLGIRLQLIGVAMIAGVSFIAVIQHQYDFADPGLVGLALSYALSITSALSGVVNAFTETEREMVAIERVNEYLRLIPSENVNFIVFPPFGWPSHGVIVFNDVVLKYRKSLPPSLRGVSFTTRPCEKIGVIGRTGAGKSSLISALFRLVELESGIITVDSVDIKTISIQSLRTHLFCIPQEPFLFSGSLRENLDPLNEFTEFDLWNALFQVNMAGELGGAPDLRILDSSVSAGGMNFSAGQKQLVCLARACLHNVKILCIDEATANVDHATDRQIKQTLKSAFRKCTVITIAHRIETILDSDRIIVMDDGRIVEFDTPGTLLDNPDSYLAKLAEHDVEQ